MRPRPVLLKFFAHPLGDQVHRQAGRVRGYDGSGFAKLGHAGQQLSFYFQILSNYLDDPVRFRTARQVILEVSNRDLCRKLAGLLADLSAGGLPQAQRLMERARSMVAVPGWRPGPEQADRHQDGQANRLLHHDRAVNGGFCAGVPARQVRHQTEPIAQRDRDHR